MFRQLQRTALTLKLVHQRQSLFLCSTVYPKETTSWLGWFWIGTCVILIYRRLFFTFQMSKQAVTKAGKMCAK